MYMYKYNNIYIHIHYVFFYPRQCCTDHSRTRQGNESPHSLALMCADVFSKERREARRRPIANKAVSRGRWLQQACSECPGARRREQPCPSKVPCQKRRLARVWGKPIGGGREGVRAGRGTNILHKSDKYFTSNFYSPGASFEPGT